MRVIIKKRSSTKAERIFYELLKRNHIYFQHRVIIDGKEIDFIIGNYAIEIDGHQQSAQRNSWLFSKGFIPIHYSNNILKTNAKTVEQDITSKLWHSQQNHFQLP